VFTLVTSYELAYTLAPARMKGMVSAVNLFTSALSSAIVLIISPAMVDPHLIWPYVGQWRFPQCIFLSSLASLLIRLITGFCVRTGIGVATFISAACIYFFFSDLDEATNEVEREDDGVYTPEQRMRDQREKVEAAEGTSA
jgi:dipeptide/tripeptide permease